MEREFLFSIIMPVYNTEDYIREGIDSLLSQTLDFKENVQLILVNDGSTDSSLDIAMEYQNRYPDNIEVVSQENQGLGAARNTGLDYVRGRYVNFLDPDDLFSDDVLEHVKRMFEGNEDIIDLVSFKLITFERVVKDHILNYKYAEDRIIDLMIEPDNPQMSVATSFIRYDAFGNLRFRTDLVSSEDTNLTCKLLLKKKAYGVLKSPVYYYRKRNDSTSLIDSSISKKDFFTYRLKNHFMDVIDYCLEREGEVPMFIQYTLAYSIQWMVRPQMPEFFTSDEKEEFMYWFSKVLSYLSVESLSNRRIIQNPFLRNYLISKANGGLIEIVDVDDNNVVIKSGETVLDRLANHNIHVYSIQTTGENAVITSSFNSMFNSDNLIFKAIAQYEGEDVRIFTSKPSQSYFRDNVCFFSEEFQYISTFDFEIPVEKLKSVKIAINYKGSYVIVFPQIALRKAGVDNQLFQLRDNAIIAKGLDDMVIS